MGKAEIVSDGVGKVAGQDVGLEGVHVHADPHGPRGADTIHAGGRRLAVRKHAATETEQR